ncbi:MAG: hypothetical protein ACOYB0_08320 [Polynucleobacter sp.]
MKTTITTDAATGAVTLTYDADSGMRKTRMFYCRPAGGAVFEVDGRGNHSSVCRGLKQSGIVVSSPTLAALAGVIRAEYDRMHRAELRKRRRDLEAARAVRDELNQSARAAFGPAIKARRK